MKKIFDSKRWKKNLLAKVVCLILAIMLWFYATDYINPETTRSFNGVEIDLEGIDELNKSGIIILSYAPKHVDIQAKGLWKDIMSYDRSKLKAHINVKGYNFGESKVPIVVEFNDNRLNKKSMSTEVINVVFDQIDHVQKQVKVNLIGQVDKGYHITAPEYTQSIEISGPSTNVKEVAYLEAVLDVSGKDKTFTEHVELVPKNTNGEEVKGVTLKQKVLDIVVPVYVSKRVPIEVHYTDKLGEYYKITSIESSKKEVNISGEKQVIDKITKIVTEDIVVENTESYKTSVSLKDIKDVSIDESKEIEVNIKIDPIEIRKLNIPTNKIKYLNLNKSFNINITENISNIEVSVSDVRDELVKLKPEDITLSVDLSDLNSGTYSIPLKAEIKGGLKYSINPEYIEITLN